MKYARRFIILLLFILCWVTSSAQQDRPSISPEDVTRLEVIGQVGMGRLIGIHFDARGDLLAVTTRGAWRFPQGDLNAQPVLLPFNPNPFADGSLSLRDDTFHSRYGDGTVNVWALDARNDPRVLTLDLDSGATQIVDRPLSLLWLRSSDGRIGLDGPILGQVNGPYTITLKRQGDSDLRLPIIDQRTRGVVQGATFSADGQRLYVVGLLPHSFYASETQAIYLQAWDTRNGALIGALELFDEARRQQARLETLGGRLFVSLDRLGTLVVDEASLKPLSSSISGDLLAIVDGDRALVALHEQGNITLQLVNVSTGQVLASQSNVGGFAPPYSLLQILPSPDAQSVYVARRVFSVGGVVFQIDVDTLQTRAAWAEFGRMPLYFAGEGVAFSADGRILYTISDAELKNPSIVKHPSGLYRIHRYDLAEGTSLPAWDMPLEALPVGIVRLADDTLAVAQSRALTFFRDGQQIAQVSGDESWFFLAPGHLAASPSAPYVASFTDPQTIQVWDDAGQLIARLSDAGFMTEGGRGLAWDGSTLIYGARDQHIVGRDIPSGRTVFSFRRDDPFLRSIHVSSEGRLLLIVTTDTNFQARASVYSLSDATPRLLSQFPVAFDLRASQLSPDGRLLALAAVDGDVALGMLPLSKPLLLYNTSSGALLGGYDAHYVAFSPDGRLLLAYNMFKGWFDVLAAPAR
ncbi:MAG: hypothetical protein NZ750_02570 [Anaerolineae bacterium]|nr:hypothetical protein [Anaerolineae bacterium]